MSPKISVIVCTYNRAEFITQNLDSFLKQSIPASDFEIIFVNNNSPDNTEEIALSWKEKHPEISMGYCLEMNQGHTYARNRGIEESKGTYLAFIDDDAFIYPDYCEQVISFFETNEDVAAIGGRIHPIYTEGETPKWMSKYLLTLVAALDMGDEAKEFAKRKFPIGANMAYRSEVFKEHGVFDVTLGRRASGLEGGDEKDMILRAQRGGAKVMYAPKVQVDHVIPPSRTTMEYVKGQAIGVGTSERKRITKEGTSEIIFKVFQEIVKSAASVALWFKYMLEGKSIKANTIVRFRYWVLRGLVSG